MVIKLEHLLNAEYPIEITPSGIDIFVKLEQLLNT